MGGNVWCGGEFTIGLLHCCTATKSPCGVDAVWFCTGANGWFDCTGEMDEICSGDVNGWGMNGINACCCCCTGVDGCCC